MGGEVLDEPAVFGGVAELLGYLADAGVDPVGAATDNDGGVETADGLVDDGVRPVEGEWFDEPDGTDDGEANVAAHGHHPCSSARIPSQIPTMTQAALARQT